MISSRQHPPDAAEAEIRRALSLAEQVQEDNLIARLLLLLSVVQASEGKLSDALDSVVQAHTLSENKRDQHLQAQTLNEMGFIYAQLGQFKIGIDVIQQALAIQAASPDLGISTYSWNIMGRACGGSGRYQQAFAAFENCRQQAAEIEDRFFLAQVPNMLGWLYRELYAFERAERCDQESVDLALRYGKSPIEISARLNLCLDWLGLKRQEESYATLLDIEEQIEAGQFGFHQWRWRLRLLHIWGLYHLHTDQAERALANSERLRDLAQEVNAQKYGCLAQQLRGDALVKLTRLDEATIALTNAVQLAESISYKPVLWEAGYQLARLRPEESQKILRKARSLVQETAEQLADRGLQQDFLESPIIQALLTSPAT